MTTNDIHIPGDIVLKAADVRDWIAAGGTEQPKRIAWARNYLPVGTTPTKAPNASRVKRAAKKGSALNGEALTANVLKFFRTHPEGTRFDVAKSLSVAPTMVTPIVNALIEERKLLKTGGRGAGAVYQVANAKPKRARSRNATNAAHA